MTLEEVKDYLRIDNDYENDFIKELIEISEIYIDSMVGEGYKTDEKAIKLASILQKKLISDMYENRSTEVPQNIKQDRIVTSILDSLSLAGDTNV
ncbi:head-tail connector protein [Clostridium cochlearium]|uniref:head-tail connector protein n=1 Tax=Clostridium cochlearium TaxID=1494 RepID=UPI000BBCE634|nr:head-tail connector protein [Clostridium cochlearium]